MFDKDNVGLSLRMELSIDTSTRYASVALSVDGEVMAELSWRSERNHSVELVPTMRRLMGHAGADMQGLRAVFVAGGPGGFSALRVGMSTAKTLADSLEIPLVSVGTLDIEARPYLGLGVPVCALIEAGKSRLYVGRYEADKGGADYEVVEYEELEPPVDSETLFCGEAVATRADVLRERLGESAILVKVPPPTRRPAVLAALAQRRLESGETDDPATLQPIYLRSAQVDTAGRTWPRS